MTKPKSAEPVEPDIDSRFQIALQRFRGNLSDLREFSELVSELIRRHKLNSLHSTLAAYDGLHEALCQIDLGLKEEVERLEALPQDPNRPAEAMIRFEIAESPSGAKTLRAAGDRQAIRKFDKQFSAIIKSDTNVDHLQRSSLISLVSVVESFLSSLLHLFFESFPAALNAKDKQFTYEELSSFSSLDEARIYLVSWRVENILRGSFEDWIDYFKSQVKLKLPVLAVHNDEAVENFQRRNLFVHNDGIVNKIYLAKVKHPPLDAKLGQSLHVSREYLFTTVDRFESLFTQLGTELWAKCVKESKARCQFVVQASYDALANGRLGLARELAESLSREKNVNEVYALMAMVNSWIARKRAGDETVGKEISAFDVSAKTDIFKLAKLALLEEHEDALVAAKKLVEAKELSSGELLEWPLFAWVREEEAFKGWLLEISGPPVAVAN